MDEEQTIELVDAITELLEENGVTAAEWPVIANRVHNELTVREES